MEAGGLQLRDIFPERFIDLLTEYLKDLARLVTLFRNSLKLLNDVRVGEARGELAEAVKVSRRMAATRSELLEVITGLRVEPSLKSEAVEFVLKLDRVRDLIREASRELMIMPYLEVPHPVREGLNRLADKVVEEVEELVKVISEAVEGDFESSQERMRKVYELEEEADRLDVSNRGMLITYSDSFKPHTLAILVHDFNKDLEDTADACTDAADVLYRILVTWFRVRIRRGKP
ncbi:MAG: DUF47 family protein [Desulfurococcaceae archaeon]